MRKERKIREQKMMKKYMPFLLAFFFGVALLFSGKDVNAASKKWFSVKETVVVKDKKNTVLGYLYAGYCYPYSSKKNGNVQIDYYGKTAFVDAKKVSYVKDVGEDSVYQTGSLKNFETVRPTTVWLNKNMIKTNAGMVEAGTRFRLLGAYGNAYLSKMDGTYVYIAKKDCKQIYGFCAVDLKKKHSMITTGDEVVDYAKQFVGGSFIWGGVNLYSGCDSAGFAKSVYEHFGYRTYLEKKAEEKDIKTISIKLLEPGDLVFYHLNSNYNHVAIYIGNNKIVHAKDQSSGITISKLNYKKPAFGLRVL